MRKFISLQEIGIFLSLSTESYRTVNCSVSACAYGTDRTRYVYPANTVHVQVHPCTRYRMYACTSVQVPSAAP